MPERSFISSEQNTTPEILSDNLPEKQSENLLGEVSKKISEEIPEEVSKETSKKTSENPSEKEIYGQFHRIEQMIGSDGLQKLKDSFVVIAGQGAVGSYVSEALARSGVGRLRLIDYDVVKPSNINRQLFALWSTVDQKKAEVAKNRILDINPKCQIEVADLFIRKETMDDVLVGSPDVLVDAIDSLGPKVELLAECQRRKQTVFSSMGAALRTNPTLVRIGMLDEVTHCPLSALLRKRLRRQGISLDIPCVYSTEPVRQEQKNAILPPELSEDNYLPQGRKRSTLGSLPTLTGIFGLVLANAVLFHLIQK